MKKFINEVPEIMGAYKVKKNDEYQNLIVVRDLLTFQKNNVLLNPDDYSKKAYNIFKTLSNNEIIETLGKYTGVCEQNHNNNKYIVIDFMKFMSQLLTWNNVRIPLLFLREYETYKTDEELEEAINQTRTYALSLALKSIDDKEELKRLCDIIKSMNKTKIINSESIDIEYFRIYAHLNNLFKINDDGTIDIKYENINNNVIPPFIPERIMGDKELLISFLKDKVKNEEKEQFKQNVELDGLMYQFKKK